MEGIEQGVLVVCVSLLRCGPRRFYCHFESVIRQRRVQARGEGGTITWAYTIHSASAHPIARSHDYRGRVQETLDTLYITTTNDNDQNVRHQNLPRSKVCPLLVIKVNYKANAKDTCQAPKPKLYYPAPPTQPSRNAKRNPRMRIMCPNLRVGKV